jgi:hypothetical protein
MQSLSLLFMEDAMKSNNLRFSTAAALIILVLLFLPVSQAFGEFFGPNMPGTAINNMDVGTVAWMDPNYITVAGSPYATASFPTSPTRYRITFWRPIMALIFRLRRPSQASR